jgi:hypothetical protein
MKRIEIFVAALILAGSLASCTHSHTVRLSNGAVIEAIDYSNRTFEPGEKVCLSPVTQFSDSWEILNSNFLADTSYLVPFKTSEGDSSFALIQYKKATVIK